MPQKSKQLIEKNVQKKIYLIRSQQVMLDSDLAELYGVKTKRLNEQVRRNIERFPKEFMFQLSEQEVEFLRSQNATLKGDSLRSQNATLKGDSLRSQNVTLKGRGRHRKYSPFVFTEQGVAMLSAVLKSKTAVEVSVGIMNAFVQMRKIILSHDQILPRLESLERRQIKQEVGTNQKFKKVFKAIESKGDLPEKGIFFDGQVFDAHEFVCQLIRKAKTSIILIDNYVDDTVLTLLTKRKKGVSVKILMKSISKQLALDLSKHNEQYPEIVVEKFTKSHDRFLILDEREGYLIGASLKDLGKKIFGFSKMDKPLLEIFLKHIKMKTSVN